MFKTVSSVISHILIHFIFMIRACISLQFYPNHKQAAVVWSLSHVQLFCDLMGCSSQVFSMHGISQARVLEWVAISLSRGSSSPRSQTHFSCIGRQSLLFTSEPPGNLHKQVVGQARFSDHHAAIVCEQKVYFQP